MEAQKRPFQVVTIAQHLCELRPQRDFAFEMVGGGPILPRLQAMIREAGLDSVIRLLGPQDDALPFYRNATAFVSTSRWEAFGLTTVEAMASNLVVVASRVPGTVDLIAHGETGLLYPKDDPREAARLLNSVLEESFPVARMREAARAQVADVFTPELQASRYLDLYRETLAQAKLSAGAAGRHVESLALK
jgi:glycosyltransferase involved in cell wall biosynthesis